MENVKPDVIALFKEAAFEVGAQRLDTLTLDTQLSDLGLDSVAVVETMGFFEDRLKVRFNDDDLSRLTTLRDLEALIEKAQRVG